jgi:hypothetical protein
VVFSSQDYFLGLVLIVLVGRPLFFTAFGLPGVPLAGVAFFGFAFAFAGDLTGDTFTSVVMTLLEEILHPRAILAST